MYLDEKVKDILFSMRPHKILCGNSKKYYEEISRREYSKFTLEDFKLFLDHHYPTAYEEVNEEGDRTYFIDIEHPDTARVAVGVWTVRHGQRFIFNMKEFIGDQAPVNAKLYRKAWKPSLEDIDNEEQTELF